MKKPTVFFASLLLLASSAAVNAHNPLGAHSTVSASVLAPDYFSGKWKVQLEGTPGGDKTMYITLARAADGKLAGGAYDEKTGKESFKFSKIEEKGDAVTVYFPAGAMEVYLTLEKKDAEHLTGNMLDMFDAKGERVK